MSLVEAPQQITDAPALLERALGGYLLVQASPGTAERVAGAVGKIDLVEEATLVAGPYDVIVRVRRGGDAAAWSKLVSETWDVAGVLRAVPCLPATSP